MDGGDTLRVYGNTNLPEGTADRPLVTFAVFAYNQEKYIREAVEGAFSQTYSPLEIILSDDCSNDRTFEIMEEMAKTYRGPHAVKTRKAYKNRGTLGHILTVASDSFGTILIVASGDDVSLDNRVEVIATAFLKQSPSAVYSNAMVYGTRAFLSGQRTCTSIFTGQSCLYGFGATAAYSRKVFHGLPFPTQSILHEDVFLASFIDVAGGGVVFVDHPLVKYRTALPMRVKHGSIQRRIQSRIAIVTQRQRRLSYYLELLKYCSTHCQTILRYAKSKISVEAALATLTTATHSYTIILTFYEKGLSGPWTHLLKLSRPQIKEVLWIVFFDKPLADIVTFFARLHR